MSAPHPTRPAELVAAFETCAAIGRAVKELGSVRSGDLYVQVCGHLFLEAFNGCIATLKGAGLVAVTGTLIIWAGPGDERERPKAQKITTENGEWKCLCGNLGELDGFTPCNADGVPVEPTEKDWPVPLYECGSCGRVIMDDTLEIVAGNRYESTTQKGLWFWAARDDGPVPCWIVTQQAEGFPPTEAFDDWLGKRADADEIAQKLARGEDVS